MKDLEKITSFDMDFIKTTVGIFRLFPFYEIPPVDDKTCILIYRDGTVRFDGNILKVCEDEGYWLDFWGFYARDYSRENENSQEYNKDEIVNREYPQVEIIRRKRNVL
ncbi:MAG: hypothetical protein ACFFDH_13570 [Promethearchaeota archaeon]